ncbi:YlaF family protein [Halobacillus salinarum]|uniref:YlaF family protein n=1 Tax=Halobacillus salinarum TaxID=2932257 RepID=A0ABY4EFC5_9BACI|nr:DUF5325 family protein [Halobacillus salinarum]UOQ43176.1 YlaF family protein [Halobacillus salinarum]
MNKFQWDMAILALFAILSFTSVGFAIGQHIFWLAGSLFLLGFVFMGVGFKRKRRRQQT